MNPAKWALPQSFPGEWNDWVQSTRRSGPIRMQNIERLHIPVRKIDFEGDAVVNAVSGFEVESIALVCH